MINGNFNVNSEKQNGFCKRHGKYEFDAVVVSIASKPRKNQQAGCPTCAMASEEMRIFAKEMAERQKNKKLDLSGIPKKFRDKTFENFIVGNEGQAKALRKCKAYAGNFREMITIGRSMVFTGSTGTGKTHLANAIANEIIEQGYTAYFTAVRKLLTEVKSTWRSNSPKSEAEVIKNFAELDLLTIDEIGVQFDTDSEKMILFDVINARYENNKPTIILSNLAVTSTSETETSIESILGARIMDRLRESGGVKIVFDWESQR